MIEKTLIILKPDSIQRGLIGEMVRRFEQRGLKILGMKMRLVDKELAKKHYSEHLEKKFYASLEKFITSGPVVAMVVEGVDAVKAVRNMVGSTEPHSAVPGTIRADFAHVSYSHADKEGKSIANLIHASGNKDDAKKEIDLWFNKGELHNYNTANEKHVF